MSNSVSNTSSIEYRLFYTADDKEAMNIYNVIVQQGMMGLFRFTDVVNDLSIEQLERLQMKTVPTIVVSSSGSRPMVYDGPQACSRFLNELIINRRATQAEDVELRMKAVQRAQRDARLKSDGPSEYSEAEMSGKSDNYAYMQTDMAQPKSFVLVGQEDTTSVITPQLQESKIGRNKMLSDMSALTRQRDQDLNSYKTDMEARQIDAILGTGQ